MLRLLANALSRDKGCQICTGASILISANAWQCVCGEEWLGDWLEKAGDSDVGDGVLGCLVTAARRCAVDPQMETDEVRSVWVTGDGVHFGSCLALDPHRDRLPLHHRRQTKGGPDATVVDSLLSEIYMQKLLT
ncbi:hypothetical protein OSTOST_02072 [Ostertagia ostertagi]